MVANKKTPPNPVGKPDSGSVASGQVPAFPKKELDKWLKAHQTWSHDDWLKLLDDLKAKFAGRATSSLAPTIWDCSSITLLDCHLI